MPPPYSLRAIGFEQDEIYVQMSSLCWNISCPNPGAEVEFLDLTLKAMNSTATILRIDADAEESLEMIGNGTVDISLSALRQTVDRMKNVDFSIPIGYLYYGYFTKEVPEIKVRDYILMAFDFKALVLIFFTGCVVGFLMLVFTRIFHVHRKNLFDWTFLVLQAMLRQFHLYIHSPVAALLLAAFWFFGCIIIITYYEAKLKTFLTLSHKRGTYFTTLDQVLDAVEYKGYTMIYYEGSYTPYDRCKPEQCTRIDKLKHKLVLLPDTMDMNDILSQGKIVGFGAVTYDLARYPIVIFDSEKDILFVRDEELSPEFLAYAVNKQLKGFLEYFNRAISITTDSFGTIRSRYEAPYLQYDPQLVQQKALVLRLTHFVQLFILSAYFIAGCILFLILGKAADIANIFKPWHIFHATEIVFHRYESEIRGYLCGFRYTLRMRTPEFVVPLQKHITWRRAKSDTTFIRNKTIILPMQRNHDSYPNDPWLIVASFYRIYFEINVVFICYCVVLERAFATYLIPTYEHGRRMYISIGLIISSFVLSMPSALLNIYIVLPFTYFMAAECFFYWLCALINIYMYRLNIIKSKEMKGARPPPSYSVSARYQIVENLRVYKLIQTLTIVVGICVAVILTSMTYAEYIAKTELQRDFAFLMFDLNLATVGFTIPFFFILSVKEYRHLVFYCLSRKNFYRPEVSIIFITSAQEDSKVYFAELEKSWS